MKTILSTIIRTARLAARRWFMTIVLVCAAGVPATLAILATLLVSLPK